MNPGCEVGLNACESIAPSITRCYGCGNPCCAQHCSKMMYRVGFGVWPNQKVRVCNDCQEDRPEDFSTVSPRADLTMAAHFK